MAIKFLSLLGFKSKSRKEQPIPSAPPPTPPVPEVTAELSVKEEFHDAIAHTDKGWFRFDSDRSELLASMTVSYDITETRRDYKSFGEGIGFGTYIDSPVRTIHTSALIRLFRSTVEDNVSRLFIVSDYGGIFIDGVPATKRRFCLVDGEGIGNWVDDFLNKEPPCFILWPYAIGYVSNVKITDVTIPDEAALKALIPNY